MLLVVATEGAMYFERHSNFAGGKHRAPLIGIVEVHMRTKPSPHSVLKRVPRDNKDPVYMYKVVSA